MIRGPFGAEAVRHLALDRRGPQRALAIIVRRLDLAGIIAERQQLIARPRDLGQKLSRDGTVRLRLQDVGDLSLQRAPLGSHGELRELRHALCEGEHRIEPQLQPQHHIVIGRLHAVGRVAREMGETGLLSFCVVLLGAVAIGGPDLRTRPVHGLAHDLGRAGERRLMNHGGFATEHPVVGVDAFDAYAGLVAGHARRLAQDDERLAALLLESRRGAREHVHQRALAHRQAEKIVEQPLQALIGERLQALEIDRERVNARPERRLLRDRRRVRFRRAATGYLLRD